MLFKIYSENLTLLGAYSSREKAEDVLDSLTAKGENAFILTVEGVQ
jgi:cell division septation protein DedD